MKNLLSIVFLIVLMYPVWWGLHDTLVPLDSTYASPGPPKMKINNKKCSSDYILILHVVERIALVWNLFQDVRGALKHLYKMFCWPMYTDLGWPRNAFAVAGDRAIYLWWLGIHLQLQVTEQSSLVICVLEMQMSLTKHKIDVYQTKFGVFKVILKKNQHFW